MALILLALAAAVLAVALHHTRARLRWERREHAVTRAGLRENHRAMERCVCGVAYAHAVDLPTRDEARGHVLAELVTNTRGPWCMTIVDSRAPWTPLLRVTPHGLRRALFVTRWGDA